MKSKMKTTFAIIAVALMVLVAVVPMIGVFTSDSDAALPVNPGEAKKIEVKGTVYNDTGAGAASVKVRMTWGSYSSPSYYAEVTADGNGNFTFDLTGKETKMSSVKVFVVNDKHEQIADYGEVKFDSIATAGTYYAYLSKAPTTVAEKVITFNLTSGNSSFTVLGLFGTMKETDKILVTYELFNANDSPLGEKTAELKTDSKFTIAYPSTATKFCVKKVQLNDEVERNITSDKAEISTTAVLTSQQKAIKFVMPSLAVPNGSFTINDAKYGYSATEPVSAGTSVTGLVAVRDSYKAITTTTGATIYWIYDDPVTSTQTLNINWVKYTLSWNGSSIEDAITDTTGSYNANTGLWTASEYTAPANTYYGSIKMTDGTNPVTADNGLTPTITAVVGDTPTDKGLSVYSLNGYYIAKNNDVTTAAKLKVSMAPFALTSIGDEPIPVDGSATVNPIAFGAKDILLKKDGFVYVGETLKDAAGAVIDAKATVKINAKVTGTGTLFGAVVTNGVATFDSTAIKMYVKMGEKITFSPASGECYTLDSASSAEFVVPSSWTTKNLKMEAKTVSLVLKDGDGKAITTGTFKIGFPDDKSDIYKAFGVNSTAAVKELAYNETTKVWESKSTDVASKSYYDINEGEFYIVDASTTPVYTFSNNVTSPIKYTAGMTVSAFETTYTVWFKDANGSVVPLVDTLFTIKPYPLYESEGGDIIHGTAGAAYATTENDDGSWTVKIPSNYVNKTIPKATDPITIAVVEPVTSNYVLEKFYLFTTDSSSKVMTITAKADSLTGTVTRTDGTPVSGALVTLKNGGTVEDMAVSSSTGSFTVASSAPISSGALKIFVDCEGYKWKAAGYDTYKDNAKVTKYKAEADAYLIAIEDADGAAFLPAATDVLTIGDATVTTIAGIGFTAKAKFTAGQIVAITLKDANANAIRTIAKHTMTATEISTGIIGLQTNEIEYVVSFSDAVGTPIQAYDGTTGIADDMKFYNYTESGEFTDIAAASVLDKSYSLDGYLYSFALPAPSSAYKGQAVSLSNNSDINTYAFDGTKFTLGNEDGDVVASSSVPVVVPVVDYFGNPLTVSQGAEATNVPISGGKYVSLTINGQMSFIYDTNVPSYHFDWNGCIVNDGIAANNGKYIDTAVGKKFDLSFAALYVCADNGKYTASVYNADGVAIGAVAAANVDLIGYKSILDTGTIIDDANATFAIAADGTGSVIAAGADYVLYEIKINSAAVAEYKGYTFDMKEVPVFYANEAPVAFEYFYANEIVFDTTGAAYKLAALDESGEIIAINNANSLVVDMDEVSMVVAELTIAEKKYDFVGSSTELYSPLSKITGALPVKAVDGDYVYVELWNEGVVVDGVQGTISNDKMSYTAVIDISGAEDAVAGVVFDSATATYVHAGVPYVTVIDPTSSYNPIIIEPGYALVIIGSDFILEHTDSRVVGNVAYLTADTMFEIVVQTTQVEGKQVVEKYTFAGWYVNGKAVNASEPSISVELTEFANTASAKYTVETYEVVEPTPEPTPTPTVDNSIDPTVLVIGICAVIIALIAVAYAVLSSRKN